MEDCIGDQAIMRATRALEAPLHPIVTHAGDRRHEVHAAIQRARRAAEQLPAAPAHPAALAAPAASTASAAHATPVVASNLPADASGGARTTATSDRIFTVNPGIISHGDLLIVKRPAVTCGDGMPWPEEILVKVTDASTVRACGTLTVSVYYSPSWEGQFSKLVLAGGGPGLVVPASDIIVQHWTVGATGQAVHTPTLTATRKLSGATLQALRDHPHVHFAGFKTQQAAAATSKAACAAYFAEHGLQALEGRRLCALWGASKTRFHGWVVGVDESDGKVKIETMWSDGKGASYTSLEEVLSFICGCPHAAHAFGRAKFFQDDTAGGVGTERDVPPDASTSESSDDESDEDE
eukprot:jgi/Mesvir1/18176/Mv26545-RA.1